MREKFAQVNLGAGWWTTLVHLGERILCLGEPLRLRELESSCGKFVRDYLKPMYGLLGPCYTAHLRAIVGCFVGIYMSQ